MDSNPNSQSAMIYIENCIIPQGFSPQEFIQYLQTKKTNGDDLSLWNMDELIEEGNEFISKAPIRQESKQVPIQQVPLQYQYPMEEQVQDQAIYKIHPGKPFIPNPQAFLQKNPNIIVRIQGFEEQQGSLFSKSFINYKIILNPYGYNIQRRYSDFDKLREYLFKNYPEYIIPPIPKKVSSSKKPDVISYRQSALERFLNLIIKAFWFDFYVDAFFSAANESELHKLVKNIPNRICDCKQATTLNGQIECQINSQIDNFFSSQNQFIDKKCELFEEIKIKCRKIVGIHQNLSEEYSNLSNVFLQLINNVKLQNESNIEKIHESAIKKVYDSFTNLSQKQLQVGELFTQNIVYFCKYQSNIFESIKDKIKYRENQKENYLKQLNKLQHKKDKLFKEQNIAKWELNSEQLKYKDVLLQDEKQAKSIMLPKESQLLEYFQDNYGYINRSLYIQVQIATSYSINQIEQQVQNLLTSMKLISYQLYDDFMLQK